MVKAIHGGEPGYPRSILYSSDGRMLSVACGKSPYKWTVWTFDTASGERGCSDELESEFGPMFWTEKDSIRFATSHCICDGVCIDIWEISPTSNGHPTKADSFRVHHKLDISNNYQISFSPASLRVAVVSVNLAVIRDVRDSKLLLSTPAPRSLGSYAGHFSSDGNLFAYTEQEELHIWKFTSEGYLHWGRFPLRFSAAAGGAFAFSPDSGSVVGWGSGIMEVWKVDRPVDPPSAERPLDLWNSHLVAFSTNGTHVAIGRASTGIVTVIDLHCGTSKFIIDANIGIVDIKMVGDTVFVVGGTSLISWDLATGLYEGEEGDYVRRAGLDESLKVVEMDDCSDYVLNSRLLDDQCQMVVLTIADDMLLADANTGACLVQYNSPFRFQDFRFSPDGRQLWVTFVDSKSRGGNDACDDCEDNENEVDDDEVDEDEADGDKVGECDVDEDEDSEDNLGEDGVGEDDDDNENEVGDGEDDENEVDNGEDDDGEDDGSEVSDEGDISAPMGVEEWEGGLEIVKDEETGGVNFVPLPSDVRPPDYPWKSPKGYKIDGVAVQWVLDHGGKRLLWLPPHWRTANEKAWRWNGDFLVLRNNTLPEPVIIQLSST